MGSGCGNICSGSVKEQEINIESFDKAVTENAGHTRNVDLEGRFTFMLGDIEYPNSPVKVLLVAMAQAKLEDLPPFKFVQRDNCSDLFLVSKDTHIPKETYYGFM